MKNALIKLLKIKSIITILMTITVIIIILSTGSIPEPLLAIYGTIIGFYFGTQATKGE